MTKEPTIPQAVVSSAVLNPVANDWIKFLTDSWSDTFTSENPGSMKMNPKTVPRSPRETHKSEEKLVMLSILMVADVILEGQSFLIANLPKMQLTTIVTAAMTELSIVLSFW